MKGFFKFILGIIIVLAVIAGGLYLAISIPKKVNTVWSEDDLLSYQEKTHSKLGEGKPANLEDLLFNNFKSTGSVHVEGYLTAEEVTAMVNTVVRGQELFTDARFAFNDDGTMEASGYLGPKVSDLVELFPEIEKYQKYLEMAEGKPIYWRYTLTREDDNIFGGHTQELRVGQIPLPVKQVGSGLSEAGSAVNNMLSKIDGFSCEDFYIDSQGMHFKGTIPEQLEYVDENNLLNK